MTRIYAICAPKATPTPLADVSPNLRSIGAIVVALPMVKRLMRLGSSEAST